MFVSTSAARPTAHLRSRFHRCLDSAGDIAQQGMLLLIAACAITYALQAAPRTISLENSGAAAHVQPSFTLRSSAETGTTMCESAAGLSVADTCPIDLFGHAPLGPGSVLTRRFSLEATSAEGPASMSIRPLSTCTQASPRSAPSLCDQLHLRIFDGSRLIFEGSAAEFGTHVATPIALRPPSLHHSRHLVTEVSLPSSLGNDYQGLTVQLPLALSASM